MKWIVMITALGGDFVLLAALVIGFIYVPKITFVLSIPTYFTWKSLGGFSSWKISTMKTFLKNWEKI